jgi:hypothetical protein
MIRLRNDCLLIQQGSGKTIPCTAHEVTVELLGGMAGSIDPDVVQHAAAAVLHYFRVELGREFVTVGEFAEALARVLQSFGFNVECSDGEQPASNKAGARVVAADLRQLAQASGKAFELGFFSRIRKVLSDSLAESPNAVQFHGLRGCVKQLLGARRWSKRCRHFEEQVVDYLRGCLGRDCNAAGVALVIR